MMQISLNLAPNLQNDYASLRKATQAACFQARGGVAGVSPDVDMSPSLLGRKLEGSKDDPHRSLDLDDFELVLDRLAREKNFLPIQYLCAKYLPTEEQRRLGVLEMFVGVLGEAQKLIPAVTEILANEKAKGK